MYLAIKYFIILWLIIGNDYMGELVSFKHQKDIDLHAPVGCPPSNAKAINGTAYRWVHKPINNDDFKTNINLSKRPVRQTEELHLKCKRCGLSMFATLAGAKEKYFEVKGQAYGKKLTYTHVASGLLTEKDGACTPPEKENFEHFTMHEYDSTDIGANFSIIDELV